MTTPTVGTCVAPINDAGDLCGEAATTERVVAEVVCRLCDGCARQIDEDAADADFEERTDGLVGGVPWRRP
jgi:hypothetical protein